MSISRRSLVSAAAMAPLMRGAIAATAMRTLRVVTGFAAGGTADIICRAVGNAIPRSYAESVVVDNRTGASGQIAIQYMKTARADGSNLLLTPMSQLGLYPYIYNKLLYDPQVDVTPASLACVFDFGIAVGPAVPASVATVPEFLQWCKANPTKANYATAALGSVPHLIVELLAANTKTELTAVLYRGTQLGMLDMLAGQIASVAGPIGDLLPYAKDSSCRILGTWGAQRSPFAPAIPTMTEQGLTNAEFRGTYGFYLPGSAGKDVVAQTHEVLVQALSQSEVKKALAASSIEASSSTPAQLQQILVTEGARWKEIIAALKFKPMN